MSKSGRVWSELAWLLTLVYNGTFHYDYLQICTPFRNDILSVWHDQRLILVSSAPQTQHSAGDRPLIWFSCTLP